MTDKLTIILGGLTLPDQTQLIETTKPNEIDVVTLDGSLYTDFTNVSRLWSATFLPLCRDDYEAVYNLYRSQYSGETYLTLICAALDINTIVKANISDKDYQWNGDQVKDFGLTLREAYAVS